MPHCTWKRKNSRTHLIRNVLELSVLTCKERSLLDFFVLKWEDDLIHTVTSLSSGILAHVQDLFVEDIAEKTCTTKFLQVDMMIYCKRFCQNQDSNKQVGVDFVFNVPSANNLERIKFHRSMFFRTSVFLYET